MDTEEELFIAVQLSHASAVRDILSHLDSKGDQALHLAAKINDLDVGRILLEFDAPLGKRNYDALTPLGLMKFLTPISSRQSLMGFRVFSLESRRCQIVASSFLPKTLVSIAN